MLEFHFKSMMRQLDRALFGFKFVSQANTPVIIDTLPTLQPPYTHPDLMRAIQQRLVVTDNAGNDHHATSVYGGQCASLRHRFHAEDKKHAHVCFPLIKLPIGDCMDIKSMRTNRTVNEQRLIDALKLLQVLCLNMNVAGNSSTFVLRDGLIYLQISFYDSVDTVQEYKALNCKLPRLGRRPGSGGNIEGGNSGSGASIKQYQCLRCGVLALKNLTPKLFENRPKPRTLFDIDGASYKMTGGYYAHSRCTCSGKAQYWVESQDESDF